MLTQTCRTWITTSVWSKSVSLATHRWLAQLCRRGKPWIWAWSRRHQKKLAKTPLMLPPIIKCLRKQVKRSRIVMTMKRMMTMRMTMILSPLKRPRKTSIKMTRLDRRQSKMSLTISQLLIAMKIPSKNGKGRSQVSWICYPLTWTIWRHHLPNSLDLC